MSTRKARRARDNNMRAAVIHVMADAAVSVLVIVGLLLARAFGWLWMDPLAGIVGACVIASWSYGLIRDTGAILLDMNPDRRMARQAAPGRRGRRRPARRSCISGGSGRATSAPSSPSSPRDPREANYYKTASRASPRCRTSRSRLRIAQSLGCGDLS